MRSEASSIVSASEIEETQVHLILHKNPLLLCEYHVQSLISFEEGLNTRQWRKFTIESIDHLSQDVLLLRIHITSALLVTQDSSLKVCFQAKRLFLFQLPLI